MKNISAKIKVAFLTPKRFEIPGKLSSGHITAEKFTDVKTLKDNGGYFDVIVVHASLLSTIELGMFPNSQVVVILDKQSNVGETYALAKKLSVFSILSSINDQNEVIEAIKNAYQSLLTSKKQVSEDLGNGNIIFVSSFNNGVGKSTISYNLANQLCTFFKDKNVCLVDLNIPLSLGKPLLNVEAAYTWENIRPLLAEHSLDQAKLASVLLSTEYHFTYLSGPVSFEENARLNRSEIKNLAEVIKSSFKAGVFDLPTIHSKEDIKLLKEANVICIVLTPDVATVNNTKAGIELLKKEYPSIYKKTVFILNKTDKAYGLTPELFAKELGIEIFASVDKDDEAIMNYEQKGKLLDNKSLLVTNQLKTLSESLVAKFF